MIRVLQVIGTLANGGMESFILNIYRHIDRSRIQFDFVVGSRNGWCQQYADEIRHLGGYIYQISEGLKGVVEFKNILKKHPEYQIVHSHRDAMSSLFLLAAKSVGVQHRICHSHNASETGITKKMATCLLLPILNHISTCRFACGQEAGEHLYHGYPYTVFPNAINLSSFTFQKENAKEIRKRLGFQKEDIIIGHIGRFEYQKNHDFLIDIFTQLHVMNSHVKFLLIGSGSLKDKIIQKICDNNLIQSVVVLEQRTDIPVLLQSMNLVIFPSFYEGFSMAMVEMQAAGLRILASDQIPHEVNITGSVTFKSLKESAENWAATALSLLDYKREDILVQKLYDYGLDIHGSAKTMQQFYEQLLLNS